MGSVNLIVEDVSMNPELRRDALQVRSDTTLETTDGEQGVAMARAKMRGLIFMDIQMPVMDGFASIHVPKADPSNKKSPPLP